MSERDVISSDSYLMTDFCSSDIGRYGTCNRSVGYKLQRHD